MTKKRYIGLSADGELHATGLEMKRTDWTNIAQKVQEDLLKMILINDATEEEVNDYVQHVKNHIKEYSIEDFIFEKIVDCRKEFKVKTKIVKAWESCGFQVEVKNENNKNIYKCIAPRGEVLLGIRWLYDNKGNPVGIPEDEPLSSYYNKIGYGWYITNQVIPIAERITKSMSYRLGKKQKDLFGELTYI